MPPTDSPPPSPLRSRGKNAHFSTSNPRTVVRPAGQCQQPARSGCRSSFAGRPGYMKGKNPDPAADREAWWNPRPFKWKGRQVRFRLRFVMYPVLALCAIVALSVAQPAARSQGVTAAAPALAGIHKIKHVIVIMQENRSFDSYFGVYPGADGIPMKGGKPSVCVPDPLTSKCVAPFVDHKDQNPGAPHKDTDSVTDVDGGKMDGFIADAEKGRCTAGHKCVADQVM